MMAVLSSLYRFPVKGLSAQGLSAARLLPGQGLEEDRRFALVHSAVAADIERPPWQPEGTVVTLARQQRLAALAIDYDAASTTLTIRRGGRAVVSGRLDTPIGCRLIEQFLAAFLAGTIPGPLRLVAAEGLPFVDRGTAGVSLISRASLRDLERVARRPLDERRFRANLVLDGLAPWQERQWPGSTLAVGAARLRVVEELAPGPAANVNPVDGRHDLNLPQVLERGYGQRHCGVFAVVTQGVAVAVGDPVRLVDDPGPASPEPSPP